MEIDGRILGRVNDYATLVALLRKRQADLGVAMETVDNAAGLPSRYTAKLLAPVPMRTLGRVSLGPMLQCLGVTLIAVEDLAAFKRIESRLTKRLRGPHASDPMRARGGRRKSWRGVFRGDSEWGRMMAARRVLTQSEGERKAAARKAARVRWQRQARVEVKA